MCDTILAPPRSSAERVMLFGKNSDRQRNEAQSVEFIARGEFAPGSTVRCTYLSIPQVRSTYALLICRPFWTWGAEMGANEHGVVIGNEGLHARSPAPQRRALVGMDLLRLALERSRTASQAVEVITSLLARHGQGGNCGHLKPAFYNNGYVIADATEAFALETVGREWVLEPISDVRAMSNRYSIGTGMTRTSAELDSLIRDCGWSSTQDIDYASAIADPAREHIGNAGRRRDCATSLLRSRDGGLTARDMMSILRSHGDMRRFDDEWQAECLSARTICMHAGGEDRIGQTVGSMVSELLPAGAVHWVTGTAAPCISIFKPVLLDAPLPSPGPAPTGSADSDTVWWRHERMHRAAVMSDFLAFSNSIREERAAVERSFADRVRAVRDGSSSDRAYVVSSCWDEAAKVEEVWYRRVRHLARSQDTPVKAAWAQMSKIAGMMSL